VTMALKKLTEIIPKMAIDIRSSIIRKPLCPRTKGYRRTFRTQPLILINLIFSALSDPNIEKETQQCLWAV
jgi:hypothetical protein